MLKISDLSIEKIQRGIYRNQLPEIYELQDFAEQNPWHNNDVVFDHTIEVLQQLKQLKLSNQVKQYLKQKVNNNTRADLLFLATLFHDIAKSNTYTVVDGQSFCPEHEKVGAEKVRSILNRFELSEKEKNIIIAIVENHDKMHILLNQQNTNVDEGYDNLKKLYPDIYLELTILGLTDTMGSHLKINNIDDYNYRIRKYQQFLDSFK